MLSIKQDSGVDNSFKILSVPSYRLSPLVFSIQIASNSTRKLRGHTCTHMHVCAHTHTHSGRHTVSVFSGNHFPKSSPLLFPKLQSLPPHQVSGRKRGCSNSS